MKEREFSVSMVFGVFERGTQVGYSDCSVTFSINPETLHKAIDEALYLGQKKAEEHTDNLADAEEHPDRVVYLVSHSVIPL